MVKHPLNDLSKDVYSVRTEGGGYRVTKFNAELNPVSFYHLEDDGETVTCNCPQSNRGPCRHIDILDAFGLYPERVDAGWFYCLDTRDWFSPVAQEVGVNPPAAAPDPEVVGSATPPSGSVPIEPMRRP